MKDGKIDEELRRKIYAEISDEFSKLVFKYYSSIQHQPKPGDVLFLISNSGRNAGCIDAAIKAREMGVKTVAITSLNHSKNVASRHPSGKRLFELCDFVLDNGGVLGDACVHLSGMEEGAMISPTSTVIDATMVNLTMTATCEKLLKMGIQPTVYTSANTDDGDRKNAAIIEEFKKRVPIL